LKIAVIGAGNVGSTLGGRWATQGYDVVFGVREPGSEKYKALGAPTATPAEAAAQADVVLLATPWPATQEAIASLGDLSGKIVLDATNPLKPQLAGLTHGFDTSGGEQVATWASGARVVKVFNTTGFDNMADPNYPEGRATMLYCGDDLEAKALAHELVLALGFEPQDAGSLTQARLLEPFALLWISLAYQQGLGRDFAFRLLRR
jgi:8-hydroxy-5-deazaflavin:NADPH oxidoreductase